ncbi:Hypothetical predicted protein [Lynx pardinus]|uniref:Secreted protein n=1 Tax=Lynx pardinus TaxID=191816 RepID=A0A485NMG2_LYNPA|nr:Hypothetical predicted protein [Lynx pardinus]
MKTCFLTGVGAGLMTSLTVSKLLLGAEYGSPDPRLTSLETRCHPYSGKNLESQMPSGGTLACGNTMFSSCLRVTVQT